MKTGFFLFLLSMLLEATTANCQVAFDVPENIVLKNQDDYARYESDIIRAAQWLETTDLNQDQDKRRDVTVFVMRWIEGSKAVTLELTEPIVKLFDKNDLLLGIFLANYSRNALENKGTSNKFSATKAAVMSVISVYKKGIGIQKSKLMQKAVKMDAEGKLDEFITGDLKVQKS